MKHNPQKKDKNETQDVVLSGDTKREQRKNNNFECKTAQADNHADIGSEVGTSNSTCRNSNKSSDPLNNNLVSWWENDLTSEDRIKLMKDIKYDGWKGTIEERRDKMIEMYKVWEKLNSNPYIEEYN